jgi:hypothetical protein
MELNLEILSGFPMVSLKLFIDVIFPELALEEALDPS